MLDDQSLQKPSAPGIQSNKAGRPVMNSSMNDDYGFGNRNAGYNSKNINFGDIFESGGHVAARPASGFNAKGANANSGAKFGFGDDSDDDSPIGLQRPMSNNLPSFMNMAPTNPTINVAPHQSGLSSVRNPSSSNLMLNVPPFNPGSPPLQAVIQPPPVSVNFQNINATTGGFNALQGHQSMGTSVSSQGGLLPPSVPPAPLQANLPPANNNFVSGSSLGFLNQNKSFAASSSAPANGANHVLPAPSATSALRGGAAAVTRQSTSNPFSLAHPLPASPEPQPISAVQSPVPPALSAAVESSSVMTLDNSPLVVRDLESRLGEARADTLKWKNEAESLQRRMHAEMEALEETARRRLANVRAEGEAERERLNANVRRLEEEMARLRSLHQEELRVATEQRQQLGTEFDSEKELIREEERRRSRAIAEEEKTRHRSELEEAKRLASRHWEEERRGLNETINSLRKQLAAKGDLQLVVDKLTSASARVEDLSTQMHQNLDMQNMSSTLRGDMDFSENSSKESAMRELQQALKSQQEETARAQRQLEDMLARLARQQADYEMTRQAETQRLSAEHQRLLELQASLRQGEKAQRESLHSQQQAHEDDKRMFNRQQMERQARLEEEQEELARVRRAVADEEARVREMRHATDIARAQVVQKVKDTESLVATERQALARELEILEERRRGFMQDKQELSHERSEVELARREAQAIEAQARNTAEQALAKSEQVRRLWAEIQSAKEEMRALHSAQVEAREHQELEGQRIQQEKIALERLKNQQVAMGQQPGFPSGDMSIQSHMHMMGSATTPTAALSAARSNNPLIGGTSLVPSASLAVSSQIPVNAFIAPTLSLTGIDSSRLTHQPGAQPSQLGAGSEDVRRWIEKARKATAHTDRLMSGVSMAPAAGGMSTYRNPTASLPSTVSGMTNQFYQHQGAVMHSTSAIAPGSKLNPSDHNVPRLQFSQQTTTAAGGMSEFQTDHHDLLHRAGHGMESLKSLAPLADH